MEFLRKEAGYDENDPSTPLVLLDRERHFWNLLGQQEPHTWVLTNMLTPTFWSNYNKSKSTQKITKSNTVGDTRYWGGLFIVDANGNEIFRHTETKGYGDVAQISEVEAVITKYSGE